MKSIFTIAIIAGIATGLLCFGLFVSLNALDMKPLAEHSFWYFPLYGLGLSAGMWYRRFKINGGFLRMWEGCCIGMLTNSFAATVYAMCVWAFLLNTPKMVESHRQNIKTVSEQYIQQTDRQEEKELYQNFLDKELANVNASSISLDIGIKTTVIGFVFGLLFGALFRKSRTLQEVS